MTFVFRNPHSEFHIGMIVDFEEELDGGEELKDSKLLMRHFTLVLLSTAIEASPH